MKENLRERLIKKYAYEEISVGFANKIRDNKCLIKETVEEAEKYLNKRGLSIVGVCNDAPLSIDLGMDGSCLLVMKGVKTGKLYWMPCFETIIEEWLKQPLPAKPRLINMTFKRAKKSTKTIKVNIKNLTKDEKRVFFDLIKKANGTARGEA